MISSEQLIDTLRHKRIPHKAVAAMNGFSASSFEEMYTPRQSGRASQQTRKGCNMKTREFYKTIPGNVLEEGARMAGLDGAVPADLQKFLELLPGGRPKLLEVGCGTGRLGIHLIERTRYTGIDFHEPYLSAFQRKLEEARISLEPKQLQEISFFDLQGDGFDVILFPWSVISDFTEDGEQTAVLKKACTLLAPGGMVIIDNFAKDSVRNGGAGYEPVPFYFDDWQDIFSELGFSSARKVLYTSTTNRVREITVLTVTAAKGPGSFSSPSRVTTPQPMRGP
jgi:SAM-dependent methyltransferase